MNSRHYYVFHGSIREADGSTHPATERGWGFTVERAREDAERKQLKRGALLYGIELTTGPHCSERALPCALHPRTAVAS